MLENKNPSHEGFFFITTYPQVRAVFGRTSIAHMRQVVKTFFKFF